MSDKTAFVQQLIDAASVEGGTVELGPGWWSCDGQLMIKDCDYVTIEGPGRLVYTGTKSPFISIVSTTYTTFDRLQVRYTNPAFDGVLVQTTAAGKRASAVANLELNKCVLQGFQGATSAHALLDLDNANIVRVLGTQFAACQRGIRMATNANSATVATTIQSCSFVGCEVAGIFSFLGSTLEALTIAGCAFEPKADGRSSGILLDGPNPAVGVTIHGQNWFGDTTKDGGGPWVTVKARGLTVADNRFASAGNGPGDYAIRIVKGSSEGLYVWNVFDAKSVLVDA